MERRKQRGEQIKRGLGGAFLLYRFEESQVTGDGSIYWMAPDGGLETERREHCRMGVNLTHNEVIHIEEFGYKKKNH